jgi:hypothetical protein
LEDLSGEELNRILGELSNQELLLKQNTGILDTDSQGSYGSDIAAAMEEELEKIIEKEK